MEQGKRIYFISGKNAFGCSEDGTEKMFESAYVEQYKQNLVEIANRSKWKQYGSSAQFQGRGAMGEDMSETYREVTGISPYKDDVFLYSVTVGEVSGIFFKNASDGEEQFLIHRNDMRFASLSYSGAADEVLAEVQNPSGTSDISVFALKDNDLRVLTSGDSCDENPSFSRCNDLILFNSRGVGRDADMNFAGLGPSCLCAVSRDRLVFEERLSEEGFDLLMPREDSEGNLYFIRKPYKGSGASGGGISLLDILVFPFRLVYGLFKGLFYLSMLSTKKSKDKLQKSSGNNPARYRNAEEDRLTAFRERIDADKEEKENAKNGEAHPGFAPRNFELYRMSRDGKRELVKKGVLSYILDEQDRVIVTNGRYVLRLLPGGGEEVLFKGNRIIALGAPTAWRKASDPVFD